MIELVMIFALGFLVGGLLWLGILPILSRRAVRLATRRLQMVLPLSMSEVVAERDQIRAGHAAATRRLEQRIERLTAGKAELMSEAGRQATRIIALQQERDAARAGVERLEADLSTATRDALAAQGELAVQMQLLHDTLGLAERRLAILRSTEARLGAAEAAADERRASIASLETRSTGQDLRLRALGNQVASAADELARVRSALAIMTGERDAARADITLLTVRRNAVQADLDDARDKLLLSEKRYASQAESLAGLAGRVAEQGTDVAALQLLLSEAKSRRDELQVERERLFQAAERAEQEADLGRSSMMAKPNDGSARLAPVVSPGPAQGDDLAVLRAAISSIAADLLRQHEASPAAPPVAETTDTGAASGAAKPRARARSSRKPAKKQLPQQAHEPGP